MRISLSSSLVLLMLAAGTAAAQHSTQFIRLGSGTGASIRDALGVSFDGHYVVGTGSGEAMLWSLDGGFVNVGNPAFEGFSHDSTALGVSNNGVVVGYVTDDDGNGNYRPWRWTAGGGFAELDSETWAAARGVSADGTYIIGDRINGELATVGYRWDAVNNFVDCSFFQSIAFGISSDGQTVGGIFGNSLGPSQPFAWTSDAGMVLLGDLSNGIGSAGGNGLSANGQFVPGFARTGQFTFEAGRFSATGNVGLGHLPNSTRSSAFCSSGDGTVIGGDCITGPPLGASEDNAFLWFEGAPAGSQCPAMKNLKTLLQDRYHFNMTGLKLRIVNGISADGKTVVGTLQRPDFNLEGFVVKFACPADFNNDGVVDFFDYLDFVDDFSQTLCNADYNFDGTVDFFDYLDFVDAFAAGCS